jgi:hypothetical protein
MELQRHLNICKVSIWTLKRNRSLTSHPDMRKIKVRKPYSKAARRQTLVKNQSSQVHKTQKANTHHATQYRLLSHTIKMEIPAKLQEKTDILLRELQSELGKHGANQFLLMRSAIHFEDNESSVINPQELINTGSPSIDWDRYVSSPPADDSDTTSNKDLDVSGLPPDSTDRSDTPFNDRSFSFKANQDIPLCKRCRDTTSNKDLDVLGLPPDSTDRSNTPFDDRSFSLKANQDIPLCKRCRDTTLNKDLDEILGLPPDLTDRSNTPFNDRSFSFEVNQDIPLCKRCTCNTCMKRLDRAKKKKEKQSSLDTIAEQFLRVDLIDFLDKYWETLKLYGLFSDQSSKPFQ